MKGFPLAGIHRRIAEDSLEVATEQLEYAERDVRALIAGEQRGAYFKADTDPVTILIEVAQQVKLCQNVLKMDDDARAGR